MARTTTGTPSPRDKSTWINDYYHPGDDDSPIPPQIKLKGWYKSNSSPPKSLSVSNKDILDLTRLKYYDEVPIVDHSINDDKDELGKGLTTKSEDDQISSLSGIA